MGVIIAYCIREKRRDKLGLILLAIRASGSGCEDSIDETCLVSCVSISKAGLRSAEQGNSVLPTWV